MHRAIINRQKIIRQCQSPLIKMRIVQFTTADNKIRIGLSQGENVVDVNASDRTIPNSMVEFLEDESALYKLQHIASRTKLVIHPLSDVRLLPPITKPDKIIGLAFNYKDACDASKQRYPPEPVAFSKFASTLIGPFDDIIKPECSNAVDWEAELAVVIGKKAKNVEAANAFDYIFGYTGAQDLTAKDWMKRNGGQFTLSKNMDTFTPLGPCIVTKDEIKDPHNIRVKTWVNGKIKQNGNTGELVHSIDTLVEYLSSVMTLLPGDLILTGTPSGVGSSQTPPQFLQVGDVLETEVKYIGRMCNIVVL